MASVLVIRERGHVPTVLLSQRVANEGALCLTERLVTGTTSGEVGNNHFATTAASAASRLILS